MDLTAFVVLGSAHQAATQFAADASSGGLVFNGFWILIAAVNFLFFLVVLQQFAFGPVSKMLGDRRQRIEQGLKDAEPLARSGRRPPRRSEASSRPPVARRTTSWPTPRRRPTRSASATWPRRRRSWSGCASRPPPRSPPRRQRALAEVRGQIADLALLAAARVVGETCTSERERRLVQEFLSTTAPGGPAEPA